MKQMETQGIKQAVEGMIGVLEGFETSLLSDRREDEVFAVIDKKTFQNLYYRSLTRLSMYWETFRQGGFSLCRSLAAADAGAKEEELRALDLLFQSFLALEKAVQNFTEENEALIHGKEESLKVSSLIRIVHTLRASAELFLGQLKAL